MSSSSSPVAILATLMALPITSAGRFWPLGPLGIIALPLGEFHIHVAQELVPITGCPFGQGVHEIIMSLGGRAPLCGQAV
jgi:hypothetical protein